LEDWPLFNSLPSSPTILRPPEGVPPIDPIGLVLKDIESQKKRGDWKWSNEADEDPVPERSGKRKQVTPIGDLSRRVKSKTGQNPRSNRQSREEPNDGEGPETGGDKTMAEPEAARAISQAEVIGSVPMSTRKDKSLMVLAIRNSAGRITSHTTGISSERRVIPQSSRRGKYLLATQFRS
jgi:hypothetical protein